MFIIDIKEFTEYKKLLFFDEIQILSHLKEDPELYIKELKKKSEKWINTQYLLNNFKLELITPSKLTNDQFLTFCDKQFLLDIGICKDQFLKKQCILFKYNNALLVYFPYQDNKVYSFNERSNNIFTLKEFKFSSGFENNVEIIKALFKQNVDIEKKIKIKTLNFNFEDYYIINKNWIDKYKSLYNYDIIFGKLTRNYNRSQEEIISLFKKFIFPKELTQIQHLYPAIRSVGLNNIKIPDNFEIIQKGIFELIIKDINEKNKVNLSYDYIQKVIISDNKLIIKDTKNLNLFLVYSVNGQKMYQIQYLLSFNNNLNINDIINDIKKAGSIDEFLLQMCLDLTKTNNTQLIINENLKQIGIFINFIQNKNSKKNEPMHTKGLQNIGATCYMNATIQCLCHVTNLKKYFQNREQLFNDIKNKNAPLTKSIFELFNNLWIDSSNFHSNYYKPINFKNLISEMNPLFQGIAANDSKDLILFIYETVHNEINKINQYNINDLIYTQLPQELTTFRSNYYPNNSSIIMKIFYFEQQSIITCLNCQKEKLSYSIGNILIFPLEKVREFMIRKSQNGFQNVSLENCFEQNEESELFNGANQIYCNNCQRDSDALMKYNLYTSPEVLTIILNRGKGLEFDVEFSYPLKINIDKYVLNKNQSNNNYELIGVLTHIGPSGMAGHFIAYCLSPNDKKWYCYNDASVNKVDDPRIDSQKEEYSGLPYVLFYQKIEDRNYNYNKSNIKKSDIIYMNDNYDKYNFNFNNNYVNNEITLHFNWENQKITYSCNKELKLRKISHQLKKQYGIEQQDLAWFVTNNEQMIQLDPNKTIAENNLKDGMLVILI